jgi:hypothetical protein
MPEGITEEIDYSVEDEDGNITVQTRTVHHAAKITPEQAAILTMVAQAPESEPRVQDYPTLMAWRVAKAQWVTAQRVKAARKEQEQQEGLDALAALAELRVPEQP